MNQGQHPADEYLEDFAEDRFYGERAWNVSEQEPASLYKLDPVQPAPLQLWGGRALEAQDSTHSAKPISATRVNAGFLPLALGAILGGLIAARLGGGLLIPFGVIAGLICGAALPRRV